MKVTVRLSACIVGLAFAAGTLFADHGEVIHCFTFTPLEASQSDWDAFYKATDQLPKKIKGLKHAWAGKLARPLNIPAVTIADAEARKKMMAEGKGTGDFTMNKREYGACMVFENEAAFKAYDADPGHKEWVGIYEKVRKPGTTTFQIITH